MRCPVLLYKDVLEIDVETVRQAISWEHRSVKVYGKVYPQPRLTKWYGPVPYKYSNLEMSAEGMPELLIYLKGVAETLTKESYNSVMCNLYRDGKDTVGWHSDNEPIFGPEGTAVASLSFGATRNFKLRPLDKSELYSIPLEHSSLLFMPRGTQALWEHTIPRTKTTTGLRVNLTFRSVPLSAQK